jgi:DNA-binding HxlR family transcriptional regulator
VRDLRQSLVGLELGHHELGDEPGDLVVVEGELFDVDGRAGGQALEPAEALASAGDRWTLLVVEALLGGPQWFNDLLGQIPGIAANILAERLKRLEREGRLIARPYSERPRRAAYQLTAEGTELAGALRLVAYWGARHADPAEAPQAPRVRHPSRGPLVLHGPRPPRRPRAPRRRGQLPLTPEPAGARARCRHRRALSVRGRRAYEAAG